MADRTVSVEVRAKVAGFEKLKVAEANAASLSRSMTETGAAAHAMRRRLESATKALPKIKIDADSSAAEIKFAELRRDLESLASKRIGIDVDTGSATMEMQRIERELEAIGQIEADPLVRVDIAQALVELATVSAELERLDGRSVDVKADVNMSGLLSSIGKAELAMQTLGATGPLLGGVTVAAGAMTGAFASAGAGILAFKGVATATMKRVMEAVDSADFSKLSPEEFHLAEQWQTFSSVYLGWQKSLNPSVIPAISGGLGLMGTALPKISPLVAGTAGSFVTLEKNADKALNGPFWTSFLQNLGVAAPQAVSGFGNSLLNVGTGVAGIVDAFLPFTPNVVNPIEHASKAFSEWAQKLKSSPEFHEFLAYVKENAPEVWELVKNLAKALGNVGEAVLPLGVGSFSGLSLLAQLVAGMDPEAIRAIALAIVAIKTAQGGLKVAEFWGDLTSKLGGLGGAADTAKGKLGGLGSSLGAGGMALLVAGAAVAVDKLTDSLSGLNPDIAELSKQIVDLGQKGKPATDQLVAFGSNLDTLAGDMGRSAVWFAPTIGQFESLGDTVKRLNDGGVLATFGTDFASTVSSVTGNLYTMDTGVQRLGNADKTLAEMVKSGNGQQAASLFNELAKEAGLSGAQVDKLKALMPEYSGAVAAAAQATAPTGDALKDLSTAASTAAGNVDTLRGAIGQLVGLTAGAMQAELDYKAAVDAAAASIKTNGDAHSTNTEKGRANRQALIDLAKSSNDYRQALIDQGTPIEEVTAKLGTQRSAFIGLAEKMGFSRGEAKNLADQLGLIPGNVKTDVKTPGGKEALTLLKEYQAKLAGLDGKTISTYIRQIISTSQGRANLAKQSLPAAAGGIIGMASGGVLQMAAGSSSVGPPPPGIATKPTIIEYAEAGYPEAFISLDPKYHNRSITVLGEVADKLGLQVYNARGQDRVATLTAGLTATNMSISTKLDGATRELDVTLGTSGALTSTVASVGTIGQQMSATWAAGATTVSDSVIGVNSAIGISTDMIVVSTDKVKDAALTVADVIAKAAQVMLAATKASSANKGGSEGSTNVPAPGSSSNKGGSQGSVIPPAPGSKGASEGSTNVPAPPGYGSPQNMVAGDYGLYGMTGGPTGASLTNYSQVSAPQVVVVPAASAPSASGTGGYSGDSGPAVVIQNQVINQDADADRFAAQAALRVRARGR